MPFGRERFVRCAFAVRAFGRLDETEPAIARCEPSYLVSPGAAGFSSAGFSSAGLSAGLSVEVPAAGLSPGFDGGFA